MVVGVRIFTNQEELKIREEYEEEGLSTLTLADRWGCYQDTIKRAIKRVGGKIRAKGRVKGSKLSSEHKKNIGKSRLRRKKILGFINSKETRKKIGIANKGNIPWNKNIPHSEETKRKIRNKLMDKDRTGENSPWYGKHRSEETKQKIREKTKGRKAWNKNKKGLQVAWNKNIPCSEEIKRNLREKALIRIEYIHGPYKNTKPELKMKEILNELSIPFEHQFRLGNHLFDFCLLNTNILVEVDGDYWHSNPKKFSKLNKTQLKVRQRDIKNNQLAKENNYILLRFWENDILNNENTVKNKLKNLIGGENRECKLYI